MTLYTNAAGEIVDASQLTEEESMVQGVEAGSWRVSGTGDSHSSALIGDEAFRFAHTPIGPQAPAKFINDAGDIVDAVAVPAPGTWRVTAEDGTESSLSEEEFTASHTPLAAGAIVPVKSEPEPEPEPEETQETGVEAPVEDEAETPAAGKASTEQEKG